MPAVRTGIDIFLTQESYDTQIEKHGQYIRWLRAQPCFCTLDSGQVDPTCSKCKGRGKLFSYQTTAQVVSENSPHNLNEVDPKNDPIVSVEAVRYSNTTDEYTVDSFTDDEILISATATLPNLPEAHEALRVDYTYSLLATFTGSATYLDQGIFTASLPPVRTRNQEPIQGEIVSVTELKNTTKDIVYTVSATARNEMYVTFADPSDEPAAGDTITLTCSYIDPVLGLLQGVTERMRSEDPFLITAGEALLTMPYPFYLGTNDLVTQLAGFQRGSTVVRRSFDDIDELPAFEIKDVVRVVDAVREYTKDTDFVLWGRNQIKWIGAKPDGAYSVMFLYHPTFSVLPSRPLVRSGENLRLPRRVGLTVYDKVSPRYDANVPVV